MKTGLVLEGGGLRGAYTAGALSWFLQEGIEFDYNVGISSGAQHLCNYLTKDKQYLRDIPVVIAPRELKVGIVPLIKEGGLVGYNRLFDYALKELAPLDLEKVKQDKNESEVGILNVESGNTEWVNTKDIDDDYQVLKAASLIPLAGKAVVLNGKKYIDAGMEFMIPIQRSVEKNVDKHLVITTKPKSYVRKPTSFLTNLGFGIFYNKNHELRAKLKRRSDSYYEQKSIIDELEKKGKALEIYPSVAFDIGRFGGDTKQLSDLFDQGFDDCEAKRDEIYKFLEIDTNK